MCGATHGFCRPARREEEGAVFDAQHACFRSHVQGRAFRVCVCEATYDDPLCVGPHEAVAGQPDGTRRRCFLMHSACVKAHVQGRAFHVCEATYKESSCVGAHKAIAGQPDGRRRRRRFVMHSACV